MGNLFNFNKWAKIRKEIAYRWRKDYKSPKDIVWFIQSFLLRGARGWSDTDYWNANEHIALVTKNILKDLKDNLNGHPDDVSMEEWEEQLGMMIKAWEILYHHSLTGHEVNYSRQKEIDVGMYLFETRFGYLWG
jgi:hypothetical protein